jgi:hypothetical protein
VRDGGAPVSRAPVFFFTKKEKLFLTSSPVRDTKRTLFLGTFYI